MSLESWREEFYPTSASNKMSEAKAVAHSLQKWRGLRLSNLAQHGLAQAGSQIFALYDGKGDEFPINSETCALCRRHTRKDGTINCKPCVLSKVRGGIACDSPDVREKLPPYIVFTSCRDPELMIKLLEKAAQFLKAKNNKKK